MKQRQLRKLGWEKNKTSEGWLASLKVGEMTVAEIEYVRPFKKCYLFIHDKTFDVTDSLVSLIQKEVGYRIHVTIIDLNEFNG